MISFSYLDKGKKEQWLPLLFDLLYENMSVIAPSDEPYEKQKAQWLSNVSPALDKAPRQIVLCFAERELAGYVQYYTRNDLLMIEEMQIKKPYRQTTLFYSICQYLLAALPDTVAYIEAYAEPRNEKSQAIMRKLGMQPLEEGNSDFVHFRGTIKNYLTKRRRNDDSND